MMGVQMMVFGPGVLPVLTTIAAMSPGLTVATETLMATPAIILSLTMVRPTTSVLIWTLHPGALPVCTAPMIGTLGNTVTRRTSAQPVEMGRHSVELTVWL